MINSKFIQLIGAPNGSGLGPLTASGNTLFFGWDDVIIGNAICECNVTTGAISPNFIVLQSYELNAGPAQALTVSNNHLYVGYYIPTSGGTVGEFDATTGVAINATLITGLSYTPYGLAVSGNNLLVGGPGVSKYNATTGKLINANFITFESGSAYQLVVRGK